MTAGRSGDGAWRACDEDFSAPLAAFRAEVDDPVSGFDDIEIVFDNNDSIAMVA